MDLEDIYQNVECRDGPIEDTTGPRTVKDEGKDENIRGSRRLVLMTVCLGIICVLLLIFIILQHIFITAERESLFKSHKNTVEEFNQTINRLQDNYTDLMTEKHQLKNNFNSLSQKNLELESKVTSLSEEVKRAASKRIFFPSSSELKSWSESRQYCRDGGGDLVIINTEEKQRHITSFIKEKVWIGLTDNETEGRMKWVDNSPLNRGFWFKGEPNSRGGNEDCILVNPQSESLNNWHDFPCSDRKKFICEN